MTLSSTQGLLALGDYMNVQCHACIGGTNVGEDIRKLDYGQHVVAGTPGRVFGECFVLQEVPVRPRSVPRTACLPGSHVGHRRRSLKWQCFPAHSAGSDSF